MLWLGLLERDTGIPAATHLGIQDEVTALELNLAVTLRLLQFDNEREAGNRKFWIALLGGSSEESTDTAGATVW